MISRRLHQPDRAFTLIEMLVVITIIIVLMGLAFPAFQGVQNAAKKTQAKNDLVQIVTAINAYYTEYGKYPIDPTAAAGDQTYKTAAQNSSVIDVLRNNLSTSNRALVTSLNPRQIVFLVPPDAKSAVSPKAGVDSSGTYWDPWGKNANQAEGGVYHLAIDGDYDGFVANPFTSNAGVSKDAKGNLAVPAGVIAWSLGKDGAGGNGDKNAGTNKDDVISWQ